MLLALDIGNTNTTVGAFQGENLVTQWRVSTSRERTVDELGILMMELLVIAGLNFKDFEGISVSCVVPPLRTVVVGASKKFFKLEPLIVSPGVKTGMPIHVDNPREVGADRIVNGVAAHALVKSAAIVLDFGTATTIDFVSAKGTFEGGIIMPGLMISMEALFHGASKLPRIEPQAPPRVIGKNTVEAMQSGMMFGYAGMIDHLITKMKDEIVETMPDEPTPKVISTGGLARLLVPLTKTIELNDERLTLEGLRIIYERNRA